MESVSEEWAQLTLALVGIGSLQPSQLLKESGTAVAAADQQALLQAGAVGDDCTRFFNENAKLVTSDLDGRVVGIAADDYLAIPRRIGLAGGERKRAAIKPAMRGGWVSVIVTDVATARTLTS